MLSRPSGEALRLLGFSALPVELKVVRLRGEVRLEGSPAVRGSRRILARSRVRIQAQGKQAPSANCGKLTIVVQTFRLPLVNS